MLLRGINPAPRWDECRANGLELGIVEDALGVSLDVDGVSRLDEGLNTRSLLQLILYGRGGVMVGPTNLRRRRSKGTAVLKWLCFGAEMEDVGRGGHGCKPVNWDR